MRVIFMGTPDFAAATLRAVHAAGHEIAAVYCQPPRAGGRRGLELVKSPVQLAAESLGLDVRSPVSLKGEVEQQAFAALNADVAVVVAYGLLLPKAVLEGTKMGCFNGHASALPRWRGAAPIHRAIMAGDKTTAMMIMKMDEGLDTGPVALAESVAIGPEMTTGDLHDVLSRAGARLMTQALAELEQGRLALTPQAEAGVTYARKISKDETRIDWSQAAEDVKNRINGLSPFPGAWCDMTLGGKPERVKLLRARMADGSGVPGTHLGGLKIACGTGSVQVLELQRAGGKPVDAEGFLRGARLEAVH